MKFPMQTIAEAKNMLRSKFIFITMILAFLFITVGTPLISMVLAKIQENNYDNFYGTYYEEDLVINGVTIDPDNDFYWEIRNCVDNAEYLNQWLENEDALAYAYEVNDQLLDFYVTYASFLTPRDEDYNSDYRTNLMYSMRSYMIDLYVLSVSEPNVEALSMGIEAVSYSGSSVDTLLAMTNEAAQEYTDTLQKNLDDFDTLMRENDFSIYVDIQVRNYEQQIEDNLARIETLEADIIANPEQEEYAADEIKNLELTNQTVLDTYIPELEYRLENNIIYNDGSWQDEAINSVTSSKNKINYATLYKMTEEEFNDSVWDKERYGTYNNYLESIEQDRIAGEEDLFVAQSSLDSGKPDMSFVPAGARQQLYDAFPLSMLVIIFSAMVGGWCIASEFQSGTVRLLMVRPRSRTKILLSRYFAGLVLVYALYAASFMVNFVAKGVMYGFADYMLPNYTASATINFFANWMGDFFAVSMSAVFIYSLSFAMSAMVKNIAVSIIVPTLALLGSTVGLAYLTGVPPVTAIAFTPLPYLLMYDFFGSSWNSLNQLIGKGIPLTMPLGAAVLAVYSALLMVLALVIFKKKDITN